MKVTILGLKIRKITAIHRDCTPKLKTWDFLVKEDEILYEGTNAYVPQYKVDHNTEGQPIMKTKIQTGWKVYFWTVSNYWKFINICSIQDFEKYVKPRLLFK